jgi:hypothetical protein
LREVEAAVSRALVSNLLRVCWDRCANTPVGYGAGLLLSIRKITLFGKRPALLANRSVRWVTGRPIGQQEIDDKVNSEVADVDAKVVDKFIMILNIADAGRR